MSLVITRAFFNYSEFYVVRGFHLLHTQPILEAVPWDAVSFAKATVAHHIPPDTPLAPALVDTKLMSGFPTPKLGPFKKPTTLVDCHGRILIWYLPGALDSAANVGYTST